jgi:RNA polymerase sigma-70 factor (ECF subfamily)
MPLARVFLAHRASPTASLDAAELEATLAALVAAARAAHPTVRLAPEAFVAHLAARLPARGLPAALSGVHAADLWLACACAEGDDRALAIFEERFLPEVDRAVQRGAGGLSDEVRQRVRERLLVASGGPPRIARYEGRGPLKAWVRVSASRALSNLKREERREVPVDDPEAAGPSFRPPDPELSFLKARYRGEFKQAMKEAAAGLAPRERTLLKLCFVDGQSYADVARLHRVNRSTVMRWVDLATGRLLEETRRILRARLDVSGGELESLLAVVRSQLSVSLPGVL